MIYQLTGAVIVKNERRAVIEAGGVGFEFAAPERTIANLPAVGGRVTVFTYLYVREDALDLYGFLDRVERDLFVRLNSISGIGPKSALGILGIAPAERLMTAINEGRTDLLTRASGVGRKTAERIVLELKGKLASAPPRETLALMESDAELEETLVSLGMTKTQAKAAIAALDPKITSFKDRLKAALQRAKVRGS